ncbi:DnaB-like helicase C-terminal domain-containing protein [Treponema sp. R6D11]
MDKERYFLARIITDGRFANRVIGFLRTEYWDSDFEKRVASWCFEYVKLYKTAPGIDIEKIWEREAVEENDRALLHKFLSKLNTDFEENKATDYDVDECEAWAKEKALELLKCSLNENSDNGNYDLMEKAVGSFVLPKRLQKQSFDLANSAKVKQAFLELDEGEEVFHIPGILGDRLGKFKKGDFCACLAPPKKGKSWWMVNLAMGAGLQGKNVLYINLEMRESQLVRRFYQNLFSMPKRTKTIRIPKFRLKAEGDTKVELYYEEKQKESKFTDDKFIKEYLAKIKRNFPLRLPRILTYPTMSLSIDTLKQAVDDEYKSTGWYPDVIFLDYADLMIAKGRFNEERHRLNDVWSSLRGYAMESDICIVTASQSGRQGLNDKDIGVGNVAEDMRKVAHVTKMFTLNQTKKEKEVGIMRIRCDIERDDYSTSSEVVVTQCYDIGSAFLQAVNVRDYYEPDIDLKKKSEGKLKKKKEMEVEDE